MLKAVCQNTLPFHSHRKITTRFDGGSLTSDAGWLLFGSLDRQHRLCEGFSSCIAESRDRRYVRHDLLKLIRQRVLQIVAGYEDCNDADTLRSDPMLKTVCEVASERSRFGDPADFFPLGELRHKEGSDASEPVAARPLCALPEKETSRQDHPGSRQYR